MAAGPLHVPAEADELAATAEPAMLEKLAALEVQRRAAIQQRRQEQQDLQDPRENVKARAGLPQARIQQQALTYPDPCSQVFLQGFTQRQADAEASLTGLLAQGPAAPEATTQQQQQLDSLAAAMLGQETAVATASYFLPSFDQKQCSSLVMVRGGQMTLNMICARGTVECSSHLH